MRYLIVLLLLVGCSGKEPSEKALFKDATFKPNGVSNEKVILGTKIQQESTGRTYYLATNLQNSVRLLCTFEIEEYSVVERIVQMGHNGVYIVIKPSTFQDPNHPEKTFKNIFISQSTSDRLENKTSDDLLNDEDTLVVVRDTNTNDRDESKKSFCEFNLLKAENSWMAPQQTAQPPAMKPNKR